MGQVCVKKGVEVKLMSQYHEGHSVGDSTIQGRNMTLIEQMRQGNANGRQQYLIKQSKTNQSELIGNTVFQDIKVEDFDDIRDNNTLAGNIFSYQLSYLLEDENLQKIQQFKKKIRRVKTKRLHNNSDFNNTLSQTSNYSNGQMSMEGNSATNSPVKKIRFQKSSSMQSHKVARTTKLSMNRDDQSEISKTEVGSIANTVTQHGASTQITDGTIQTTLKNSTINSNMFQNLHHNQEQHQLQPIVEESFHKETRNDVLKQANTLLVPPNIAGHKRTKSHQEMGGSTSIPKKKIRKVVKQLKSQTGLDQLSTVNIEKTEPSEVAQRVPSRRASVRRKSQKIEEQEKQAKQDESEPIKYCIGELIGSGAYGKVYQGLDMATGQLLAIKQIKFQMKNDAIKKELRTIKHEIQLLQSLYHPNIVKYYSTEISQDGNGADILLELVPGGSIRQLLDKFLAFDERLVKIYTRQMLEGLNYLHENNIIHRDLKCANVLVDNMGVVKLSDFGASKKIIQNFNQYGEIVDEKLSKSVIGSPYWMAPEIMQKIGHGKPADIWSLGCCVIEMLTSKPPWIEYGKDAKTIMDLIKTHGKPPKYPDNISKECKGFLDYCFEQDQTKRPTAQELLYHPFVLMKNPKALQESMEAAKLMQNRISQQSMGSAYMKSFQSQGMPGIPPHQGNFNKSINSVNSFNFNSQLNMGQFLQNHQQMNNQQRNYLDPPGIPFGNNFGSINSLNSIMLGFDHPGSLNIQSILQGSQHMNMGQLQKSTGSYTSNGRLLTFAEKLKLAHDKQRKERQEVAIQNWVKIQSVNQRRGSRTDEKSQRQQQ
ncbi:mitogen-activated protein kinase kinase kinase 3-like [Stylonychia lemnae]|uniref:Mitogen-activated protein kinase kinase kinase 3-like n=1 Tax=Stylonychia lemnae TaxID=5949 RepID=A0A078AVJ5_STYLE|nr:mitogen-activated protein kinase kinase kinase 3-like [Stylonychia lemnae]|eukprot:CDW84848.1 mitogen-activated protein kinase kinase kinase 3-like [Stylonychia lemnae]